MDGKQEGDHLDPRLEMVDEAERGGIRMIPLLPGGQADTTRQGCTASDMPVSCMGGMGWALMKDLESV